MIIDLRAQQKIFLRGRPSVMRGGGQRGGQTAIVIMTNTIMTVILDKDNSKI